MFSEISFGDLFKDDHLFQCVKQSLFGLNVNGLLVEKGLVFTETYVSTNLQVDVHQFTVPNDE